jgi:hypothetical protein
MILKNTYTKYNVLELSASDEQCKYVKMIGCIVKKQAIELYGDIEVLSVKEYDETKTSSVIIKDNDELKGFVIKLCK